METFHPDPQSSALLTARPVGGGPLRLLTTSVSVSAFPTPIFTLNRPECCSQKFETLLKNFGSAAQKKFYEAIEALPKMKLEKWFVRLLDHNIIPTLARIGFDESLARAFFQIAASDWQRMGPDPEKCIWFHPVITGKLREIRDGIISTAGSCPDEFLTSQRIHHKIIKRHPHPASLSTTCEDISSSWIILPRVYYFLEQQHARCLLGYLKCLEKETHIDFRKILTRIIIEFTGNYTHKYRNRCFARQRVDSALFYGYAAMFWRCLIHPPEGFEDELIFSHCLRWIKLFKSKCADLNWEMAAFINHMEAQQKKVLLLRDAYRPTDEDKLDLGSILVTLRHGRPGMDAVLNYVGILADCAPEKKAGGTAYTLLPAAVNELLTAIRIRLPSETPTVQNSMRKFVRKLRDAIASKSAGNIGNSDHSWEQRQFVLRRVLGLIDDVAGSWA